MKILRFPVRQDPASSVAERIASVERLLTEWSSRQSDLRENGRRLRVSLERLSLLTGDLLRSTNRLRRSARHLRTCRVRLGSSVPPL